MTCVRFQKDRQNDEIPPSFLLVNFQSLLSKQHKCKSTLTSCGAHIVTGSGTWLPQDVADSELLICNRFHVFRKDRKSSRERGVLIAVSKSLNATLIQV